MTDTKPGFKTTEFWIGLLVVIIGSAAAIWSENEIAKLGGMVAAALTAAGYSWARATAKKGP